MDCGNKNAMVDTNTKVLGFLKDSKDLVSKSLKSTNSVVIPPCFIGEDVTLTNSIVGPNVSIEKGAMMLQQRRAQFDSSAGLRVYGLL
ncbi:MAG: hypothetical protein R2818_07780 [Flavobacteriales bacterium]